MLRGRKVIAARVIPGRTNTALPWFLSEVTTSLIRWVIARKPSGKCN